MKPQPFAVLLAAATLFAPQTIHAAQFVLTIHGTDAIFLAGRSDITVPDPSQPWNSPPGGHLVRHGGATPEEAKETFPVHISVAGGDVVKVADPAEGGVNFFNGSAGGFFGPEGNAPTSSITSLGDISGYQGTQGALAGVFLGNGIPNGSSPPPTLNFQSAAAREFTTLSPLLGQVFFIGDGQNSAAILQEFIAPVGATRLFFGIPDGFAFNGPPGAYDDNDGAYRITVGVNEDPPDTTAVPDGGTTLLALTVSLAGLLGCRHWFSGRCA